MLAMSPTLTGVDQRTRAHHGAADAPWSALLSADVRTTDYVHQLIITYGFEAPLECAFAYTPNLAHVVDLRDRARSGLLLEDLLELGYASSQLARLPQCFSIAPFEDVAEALGWLYVVERPTLQHSSVRRHLLQRFPDLRTRCRYLAAAGSVAAARWQAFGVALDRFATTDAIADRVALAANHAFRRWLDWVAMNERERSAE